VTRRTLAAALLGSTLATLPGQAHASLAGALHGFIAERTLFIFRTLPVAEPLTDIVERQALRGIEFPATATAPGFTYTFNPEFGTFERSSGSLGPLFDERADTVGRGRLAVGASYLHADLTDEDGVNFGRKIVFGVEARENGVPAASAFVGRTFSLVTDLVSFSGTYGLTDRWDVNALVPLADTALHLSGVAGGAVGVAANLIVAPARFDDRAFGLADVLLRTKYRVRDAGVQLAGEIELRLPTGNERNFQGLGVFTFSPLLVATRTWGRQELHANVGTEIVPSDLDRSSARYAVGAVLSPFERFAVLVDVLGSSTFVSDNFSIPTAGKVVPAILPSDFVKAVRPNAIVAYVPRADLVNLSLGGKLTLFRTLVAFADVLLPITSDGLRAAVIPVGGIEYTF
jgi:hypothetical protein